VPRFWQRDQRPPLYPFLAAIYPVLALAHANAGELIQAADLRVPVLAGLYVGLVAWVIGRAAARERHRTAVLSLAIVMLFSVHGYITEPLYRAGLGRPTAWEALVVGVELLVLVVAVVCLRRSTRDFAPVTRFMTAFVTLLVGYVGLRVALDLRGPAEITMAPVQRSVTGAVRQRPDIYLIVPDKYTGSSYLAKHYEFNNRPFEDSLRARGFTVPGNPRANYNLTFLALAAMLNFRYLDDYPQRYGVNERHREVSYPNIEYNALATLLKANGYEFVFFPTAWGATKQNRMADRQIPHPSEVRSEFAAAWLNTTIVPALARVPCILTKCIADLQRFVPESPASLDRKLARLSQLDGDRPKFVFVHLTIPHEPFLYAADCTVRTNSAILENTRAAYLEQIQCTNAKLLHVITALQRRSRIPPVILVQADHGHGAFGDHPTDTATISPAQVAERLSVFAAFAIPGLTEPIPDTIGPVNAVRLMLRHVLREDLPALEERSYWSDYFRPYDFTRVH
jgi:hypothetical protein